MFLSTLVSRYNPDDDCLYIMLTDDRGKLAHAARIAPWERHLSMRILRGDRKQFDFFDEEATLLNMAHNSRPKLPVHNLVEKIPEECSQIAQHNLRYQYQMLRLLSHEPHGRELYHDNRMLFYTVAYHAKSISDIKSLLKQPRHKILQTLYPENLSRLSYKSVVRILKKMLDIDDERRAEIVSEFLSLLFSNNLPCDNEKMLLHVKYIPLFLISRDALEISLRLHPDVLFGTIQKIVDKNPEILKSHIPEFTEEQDSMIMLCLNHALDYINMSLPYNPGDNGRKTFQKLKRARTCSEVEEMHHQIMVYARNNPLPRANPVAEHPFEIPSPDYIEFTHIEPPIPALKSEHIDIIPLRNYEQFIQESEEMNHCLAYAGYANAVARKEIYIYKVITHDDRCTLELGISNNRQYVIRQLRSYNNRDEKPETRRLVQQWIKQHTSSEKSAVSKR